ncbi:SDR family oxidoreductase [Clostridium sp. C8-1-8]|uniref:SDR family NAD(P)-dependent oxidoreductase n=1 Tax=Clostridium sp. C8-1-8 TaxID=2698831 RepID=UPI00136B7472|nr:SDR family oxidoreductase [Clostridium sp. C8-1-8]
MKNVLITGGTTGIGFELAKRFAKDGYGIVIVSSSSKNLQAAKQSLENDFNIKVWTYEKDLSKQGAAIELYNLTKKDNISIDILINNAGIGLVGATETIDLSSDEDLMLLNVVNLAELCKLYIKDMYVNKNGKILNVASIGAFQPGPYTSTYFASKAFVLSYSRAIGYEARGKGVQVSTLCPGATKTHFFQREGTTLPKGAMEAEKVADYTYRSIMKGKEIIIPGFINRLKIRFPMKLKLLFVAKMKK